MYSEREYHTDLYIDLKETTIFLRAASLEF